MTPDELRARVADVSVWSRGDERAPHKPLVLLLALGRLSRGEPRMAPFAEIEPTLKRLLQEFGPPRTTYHPEYPFWYLRTAGLWEVTGIDPERVRESRSSEPSRAWLVREEATGGLTPEAFELLRSDPALLREAAVILLRAHFPDTVHDDLLDAVGLDLLETVTRRKRDPRFRDAVLVAYQYRCAVCGFDARLRHAPIGIEAAHIRWHQAHGPDTVPNGLALCALHHKLFDRGALTVREDGTLAVSPLVNGAEATERWLVAFDGRAIEGPRESADVPDPEHLAWHRREVFRAS